MADPQTTYHQRYVVITATCILIFSPVKSQSLLGQLEFWATLQSLERIRRNMNYPNIVALQWRPTGGESQQPEVTILKIGDSKAHIDAFINCIVTIMKEMGVAHKKSVQKNVKIAESDVSKGSVAKMDIRNLMAHIDSYEEVINSGELDIATIQTLTTLYPRAIEYYSAFDNNMYNDLLNRMQSLLQREDIQAVLSSADESANPKTTPVQNPPATSTSQTTSSSPPKPKIDFNVSKEDVEIHRKKMEEESK